MISPQCNTRTQRHCKIIAQAIKPYTFDSSLGVQHIDSYSAIGNRCRPQGQSMCSAHYKKH